MALLTRDERKTLDRPGRIALRRERRGAPLVAGDSVKIAFEHLKAEARELILDMANEHIPGPEKMDEVLSELAATADQFLVWTWAGPVAGSVLEAIDGPIGQALVRLAIRPYVQRVYEEMRNAKVLE